MTQSALLPERHPDRDFFIADIFDAIPVKDDIHTMEHPFFSLSTKKCTDSIEYSRNGVNISLSPSAKHGQPTIFDKDILLYCGSLVMAELNKGKIPPRTLRFSAHDLMVTTNRMTNGQSYKLLKNAFERLTGCMISTNIKTQDIEEARGFHILEDYLVVKSSRDGSRMVEIEVTLSYWLYRALLNKEVLSINRNYFRLRQPLARRLYEIVRKHCGNQELWEIKLDKLKDKVGSTVELYKFRYDIRQLMAKNRTESFFPDYYFLHDEKTDVVSFTHRPDSTVKPMKKPDFVPPPAFDAESVLGEITTSVCVRVAGMCRDVGYDFNFLVEDFTAYMKRKGKPDNVSGAFINFAKKKIKNFR